MDSPSDNVTKFFVRIMKYLRRSKTMSIEIPAEFVPKINELKTEIDSLNKQGAALQAELDVIKEQGVEIKILVKTIEDIDMEEIKGSFLSVTQAREEQLNEILVKLERKKVILGNVVTNALLG